MFDLFPFPRTIVYEDSPVTRSSRPASRSSAQDDNFDLSASSLGDLKSPQKSRLLEDDIDGNGFEFALSSPALGSAAFLGSNGSESTSTRAKNYPEQQDTSSHKLRKRKGHKKSRNGCYNCKKRKIKCPENQPACHNCTKIKLDCIYPPRLVIRTVESPPLEMIHLQSTPTVFDLTDMRLFHHFLMNCYPHLPLGNDNVWVRDIAAFAHSYDFLVQAMLGLAASHLMMTSTSELSSPAFSHRVKSMKGLNTALSTPPKCAEESDAILATTWALAFQTSYIGESVEEFLAMLRGCTLIVGQDWRQKFGTAFQRCTEGGQSELIIPRLETLPLINQDLVAEARVSFEQLRVLAMNETENDVFQYMDDMVELLSISSLQAYMKYKELYYYLGGYVSHENFQTLVDPSNAVAQILLAHFVAMLVLFAPIKSQEWSGRNMGCPNRGTVFRLDGIWNIMPKNMRRYLQWPMIATGAIPGVPSYVERACGWGVSWLDNIAVEIKG